MIKFKDYIKQIPSEFFRRQFLCDDGSGSSKDTQALVTQWEILEKEKAKLEARMAEMTAKEQLLEETQQVDDFAHKTRKEM